MLWEDVDDGVHDVPAVTVRVVVIVIEEHTELEADRL